MFLPGRMKLNGRRSKLEIDDSILNLRNALLKEASLLTERLKKGDSLTVSELNFIRAYPDLIVVYSKIGFRHGNDS
jgi:hypothetical protein